MQMNIVRALFNCLLVMATIVAPVMAQEWQDVAPAQNAGQQIALKNNAWEQRAAAATSAPGTAQPYISGYLSRPTSTMLPYTATSAVDINVVGDPVGSGFGGCSNCGGAGRSGSRSGGGCPQVQVPADCYGCFPVVNTHNGCIMGYKNANETWRDFWTGKSGHLADVWLAEGEICLQQMIGAGMNPDSTGIPAGMGM